MKHLILISITSFCSVLSYAQKQPYVIIFSNDKENLAKEISGVGDSLEIMRLLKRNQEKLLQHGYLLASSGTINWSLDTIRADLYMGKIFRWGLLNMNNVPEALLAKIGYKKKNFEETRVSAPKLGGLLAGIIKESEMNGYPFAKISLDSVRINNDILSASTKYEPGPQIRYSELVLSDTGFVKSHFLATYLEISKKTLFNSTKIEAIPKKIDQLPYCQLEKPPSLKFENNNCQIKLTIKPLKANKVDAMIGFAPNQLEDNKLLATGYVNLDLHNLFKSGKRLFFNWRQFGLKSQKLTAFYYHTNLFNSVINMKGEIDLLKQDTSFVNRDFQLHVGYKLAKYELNLISSFLASRLLSNATLVSASSVSVIDFDAQYYGVEFVKNELDNEVNPRRGWALQSRLSLGSKSIRNTSFVPVEVYDSLEKQMLQWNFHLKGKLAIPISQLFVGYAGVETAVIKSASTLFSNDLYRLGGINSVRGFNELELYSSSYVFTNLEMRLMLGADSRLFGFVDWAYSTNEVSNTTEQYLGLGAGILLNTAGGTIQLVYAVGQSAEQSLSLTESKIHLGYVARF